MLEEEGKIVDNRAGGGEEEDLVDGSLLQEPDQLEDLVPRLHQRVEVLWTTRAPHSINQSLTRKRAKHPFYRS